MSSSFSSLSPSLRIGVLRGGPSPEYDVSLKSGNTVLKYLSETHQPLDIFISRDGRWHIQGVERAPERILSHVDVVFNALHGAFGEDGGVQEILDSHGVPYTGSNRYSSAIAMNKWMSKERVAAVGVKTPVHMLVRKSDPMREKASEVFNSIPSPLIVKPVAGGSSLGLFFVESYMQLLDSLEHIFSAYETALVEEFIAGREATAGVIDDFRGEKTYALPVVEIIVPDGKMFDYDAKYSGENREVCPSNFTLKDKKEIERLAALVHNTLGLSHYSRSDFIVSPRRGIYFLEVNTLPGLTEQSLLPKSLEAVGIPMRDFLHHTIGLALRER